MQTERAQSRSVGLTGAATGDGSNLGLQRSPCFLNAPWLTQQGLQAVLLTPHIFALPEMKICLNLCVRNICMLM